MHTSVREEGLLLLIARPSVCDVKVPPFASYSSEKSAPENRDFTARYYANNLFIGGNKTMEAAEDFVKFL